MSLEILKKYKIKAKKSLWQNFLVNDEIVEEISDVVEIQWKNIVEVWPWYWALTEKLLSRKPKSLNLVELDTDMIEILEKRVGNKDFYLEWIDFKINNIDILKYEPNNDNYSVIANIPYYITSPILRHFLYDIKNKPENMVILMQKDVWDKILWKWKNKSSVLSLFIGKKTNAYETILVPKENFIPAPKVESSVLLFEKHDLYKNIDDEKFLNIIKKWFREPRKMLIKNLVNSWFEKEYIMQLFESLWIENKTRAEDLDILTWCEIVKTIND